MCFERIFDIILERIAFGTVSIYQSSAPFIYKAYFGLWRILGSQASVLSVSVANSLMVNSNERGRALEFAVAHELENSLKKRVFVEVTERTIEQNRKHWMYFNALDKGTQKSFLSCARTFAGWIEKSGWLEGATKVSLDRIPDNEAKGELGATDIQLSIFFPSGIVLKNISVKHGHDALCHPRLPSLAEQAGVNDPQKDAEYRKGYEKIWGEFYSKTKKIIPNPTTYKELDRAKPGFKNDTLFAPLLKHATKFLSGNATSPGNAKRFFQYIVGQVDYYVLKNGKDTIQLKHFVGISPPQSFTITYPYKSRKNTFLAEFDNRWKITFRIHTATSKISENGQVVMTEKIDPICRNLAEVIKIETIKKQ